LTYAQQPDPPAQYNPNSARSQGDFYLADLKDYFLDQFVGTTRKCLVCSIVKCDKRGFSTKLPTNFVDKNIALTLQWLSVHFNTSREDVKPSQAHKKIFSA
jgi:hypothetical protein